MTSKRRRWRTAIVIVLVVVAVAGSAGAALALRIDRIADDLARAEDQIDAASEQIRDGRLAEARASLDSAAGTLTDANGDLHNAAEIIAFGGLPVVAQNLDSLRDTVGIALVLVARAGRILELSAPLEDADGRLQVPLSAGAIPLDVVADVNDELAALLAELPLEAGPDPGRFVLDSVADLRVQIDDEVATRRAQLTDLERGLRLVTEMAGGNGPRRYLIAVANTAEMRGAGGMILNYGILEGADGRFTLGEFGRVEELDLAVPVDADITGLPRDYLDRWSGFDPLLRMRNATLSADFALTAPVLEFMYQQATGVPVDGVIQIDPQGLAALLTGTGPVTVPELGRVDADNVVALTLNEAYVRFPAIEERSEVLQEVAEATFERLTTGSYPSLRPLADALIQAVDEGHVVAHARRRDVQAIFTQLGADSALPASDEVLALAVQNTSANKLDYYLDTSVAVTGSRPLQQAGEVEVAVTLTNTAPTGAATPRYIFGPNVVGQVAGQYRGSVSLYVPRGASVVSTSGDPLTEAPSVFAEADRTVIGWSAAVDAGASVTTVLRLRLPPRQVDDDPMTLVALPRVRPTTVDVDLDLGDQRATAEGPLRTDRRLRLAAS